MTSSNVSGISVGLASESVIVDELGSGIVDETYGASVMDGKGASRDRLETGHELLLKSTIPKVLEGPEHLCAAALLGYRALGAAGALLVSSPQMAYEEEDVELTEDAMELLTMIGMKTSLRYAIQMITAASLVAAKRKAQEVDKEDLRRVYQMFVDIKRSTEFLKEHEAAMMFSEDTVEGKTGGGKNKSEGMEVE